MEILLLFILALVGLTWLFVSKSRKGKSETAEDDFEFHKRIKESRLRGDLPDIKIPEYKKRYRLMNNSESSFFHALKKVVPENMHIFPKMRIADVLEAMDGVGFYKRRNFILPKHVDFVICNEYFNPLLAIEIDGKSHLHPDRMERDRLVDQIFQDAGLKMTRVIVGSNFDVEIDRIISLLKS